jgi:hypothetical protein
MDATTRSPDASGPSPVEPVEAVDVAPPRLAPPAAGGRDVDLPGRIRGPADAASMFTHLLGAAAGRHGLVTRTELLASGLSSSRVERWARDGRLERLANGVYRLGGVPPTLEGTILAGVLVAGRDTLASHRTAAWLWGLPGFGRPGRIELSRPAGRSNQRSELVIHRTTRVDAHHRSVVRSIPVTSLPRTVFDLAAQVGALLLDRAVEAALRTPHCTVGALFRVLEELGGRGRPGTAAIRRILHERGRSYVPTESELDVIGRTVVRSIEGIEWQVPISDERGYIRRVDGFHRRAGLVIEWDGAAFHGAPQQRALDDEGDRRLRSIGLEVVRFGWHDVTARAEAVRGEVRRRVLPTA